jgi:hypothetical protein
MEKLKQRVCKDVNTLIETYARELGKSIPTATRTVRTKLSEKLRELIEYLSAA